MCYARVYFESFGVVIDVHVVVTDLQFDPETEDAPLSPLTVNPSTCFLPAAIGELLTIPCVPTNKDVQVTLTRNKQVSNRSCPQHLNRTYHNDGTRRALVFALVART